MKAFPVTNVIEKIENQINYGKVEPHAFNVEYHYTLTDKSRETYIGQFEVVANDYDHLYICGRAMSIHSKSYYVAAHLVRDEKGWKWIELPYLSVNGSYGYQSFSLFSKGIKQKVERIIIGLAEEFSVDKPEAFLAGEIEAAQDAVDRSKRILKEAEEALANAQAALKRDQNRLNAATYYLKASHQGKESA